MSGKKKEKSLNLKNIEQRTKNSLEIGSQKSVVPGLIISSLAGLLVGSAIYNFAYHVKNDKKILSKTLESEHIEKTDPILANHLLMYQKEYYSLLDKEDRAKYVEILKKVVKTINEFYKVLNAAIVNDDYDIKNSMEARKLIEITSKLMLKLQKYFTKKNDWQLLNMKRKQIITELIEKANCIDVQNTGNWL